MKNDSMLPLEHKRIQKAESCFYKFLNLINAAIPIPGQIETIKEKTISSNDNSGVVGVVDEGVYWKLGFSECNIVPSDVQSSEYYIGGNISVPPRKLTHIIDYIKVRTIALSTDNNHKIVLSVVDCIGLTNFYINKIRKNLTDFCLHNSIKTINVFSTHTHSSIDSMGIWSVDIPKIFSSFKETRKNALPEPSVNKRFMEIVIKRTEESIKKAVNNMQPGRMFLAEIGFNSSKKIDEEIKKSIGFDSSVDSWSDEWQKLWDLELSKMKLSETGIYEYILPKRSPYEFSPKITRIRFKPLDTSVPETIIVNLSAHPYSNGLNLHGQGKGNGLSGDYVYYMEEVFNQNNCNMIFFNGAINGIYPKRKAIQHSDKNHTVKLKEQTKIIGNEIASITLAASMQLQDIYLNKTTNPQGKSSVYQTIIHKKIAQPIVESEIEPKFKSYNKFIFLKCANPLEQIIGKLNFAQFNLFKAEENNLYIKSEIGIIQLGDDLNIALIPGEITNSLCAGQVIYPSKSRKKSIDMSSIDDILGENTLVFGLANDAIGYIIHPDDYCMVYLGNGFLSKKLFGKDFTHYQEIFSLGENVSLELLSQLKNLKSHMK